MGKLYVVTRNDLPIAYQAVQAGHAVAEWMLNNESHPWRNNILVYLTVPDAEMLEMLVLKLRSRAHRFSVFREPDLNNEQTALACYTESNFFDKLKMMGTV